MIENILFIRQKLETYCNVLSEAKRDYESAFSRTRMGLVINLSQVLKIEVRVYLSRRNIRVPEQLLYRT